MAAKHDPYKKELEALARRLRIMAEAYGAPEGVTKLTDYYAGRAEAYGIAAQGIEEIVKRRNAKAGGLFDATA